MVTEIARNDSSHRAEEQCAEAAGYDARGQGEATVRASTEEGPLLLTPELALVDPELAKRARAQLREYDLADAERVGVQGLGGAVASPVPSVAQEQLPTEVPEPPLPRSSRLRGGNAAQLSRRPHRLSRAAGAVVLVGVALLVVVLVLRRDGTTPATSREVVARTHSTAADRGDVASRPARATRSGAHKNRTHSAPGSPRVFVWAPVRGAASYDFQLFRKRSKIFEARPKDARLALPTHWVYRRRHLALTSGRYRWIVRPVFGSQDRPHVGRPVVVARLVIAV